MKQMKPMKQSNEASEAPASRQASLASPPFRGEAYDAGATLGGEN